MDTRRKILIADPFDHDVHDLRRGLIAEGYEVRIAKTVDDIIPYVESFRPDLILIEPRLRDFSPEEMLAQIRQASGDKVIPIVFASHPRSLDERLAWLELDVDEVVNKPCEIDEIVVRFEVLIKEAREANDSPKMSTPGFSGSLAEMSLVDLLQTLDVGKKTAVIHLQKADRQGRVYVTEGEVIDAELEQLEPRAALLRMFTWNEGQFSVSITGHDRPRRVFSAAQELISEGVTRLYRWEQLSRELPALQSVVLRAPDRSDVKLMKDEQRILEMVDGKKRFIDIIEESPFDDLKALRLLKGLFEKGIVLEAPPQKVAMTAEYLEKFKSIPENGHSKNQVMEGVFFTLFRKPQTVPYQNERRRVERRRGDRRRHERRRNGAVLPRKICLNRSELILIREKLIADIRDAQSKPQVAHAHR